MRNLLIVAKQMTPSCDILDMATERTMDYATEQPESLEDRCLAITGNETVRNKSDNVPATRYIDHSVTSIDLSQSRLALAAAIAASRRQNDMHSIETDTEVRTTKMCEPTEERSQIMNDSHGEENCKEMISQGSSHRTTSRNSPLAPWDVNAMGKRMDDDNAHPSTPNDVNDELKRAKEMIKTLQERVEKLESQRSTLSEANQQWAIYAEQLKAEHKTVCRSVSVDDVRKQTSPKRMLKISKTEGYSHSQRKSEGDMDAFCGHSSSRSDSELVMSLKGQVTLLTQQVRIYKDDFALERRDRVRSVMEAKKMKKEVERLKGVLVKQKQHNTIKEQYLTCEDFDYLNH